VRVFSPLLVGHLHRSPVLGPSVGI
jgi:hypothetical protein